VTTDPVWRYHDGTKHHFDRYAQSLGYLDWASQPRPFRAYEGARRILLPPQPGAGDAEGAPDATHAGLTFAGHLLRYSLGLSAWKIAGPSRWALRVNPSSGNLHPTEAYIVCGGIADTTPSVWHYAPDAHALEQRCAVSDDEWREIAGGQPVALLALTSIHWREAWKYGERAFRYCQHDLGHAIAAVAVAARMLGWRAEILPEWSHADMASLIGIDRDGDFLDAEREEPGCVLALVRGNAGLPEGLRDGGALAGLVRRGQWSGRASQLSEAHVEWRFIDEVAAATRTAGVRGVHRPVPGPVAPPHTGEGTPDLRAVILRRRSAVAFDGHSSIDADVFLNILSGTMPSAAAPWDAVWWPPSVHLLLFVHRVQGVDPGLYLLARSEAGERALMASIGRAFETERAHPDLPLTRLGRGDCRGLARRLNCHQDIAADGAFTIGMLAEFDAPLATLGPAFYRNLFWETGVVGQMLYLEAEAAGIRGTGIGCFFDDPVHDVLGLTGHAFQSLYHFTIGTAVDDARLTTQPGYPWEAEG
jgi:SagB-type dehydrogenase family enzyme